MGAHSASDIVTAGDRRCKAARRGGVRPESDGEAAGVECGGEGDVDYVVGNTGLNTKYDSPALLYYGDVDGSGEKRILEAEFEDGKCYPIRGLSCSSNAMPFLRGKTPKFHDFASATLIDLYAGRLEKAQRFEANTLESGVLMNDGKGRFEFRALPSMAQVAPVFGIAMSDFDADGNQDLFLAQNSFSPQVETGRMDGGTGILLRGLGDGNFSAVRADQSGLLVPGDAKGVALTDLNGDGWQDLLVAVNNSQMKAYESIPPAGGKIVTVDLDAADALKIGSLVTATLSSGKQLIFEITAGGSYLSQSSRRIRFVVPKNESIREVAVRWSDGKTDMLKVVKNDSSIRIGR